MTTFPAAVSEARDQPASARRPGLPPRSPLCAAICRIAVDEFRRWRPAGGPALVETSPAASPILREYYRVGVGANVADAQLQSASFQATHAWSAVFVSYVMRRAGAGPAFAYSALHQTYIRAARENRLRRNTANPFWAFRATEVAPGVGDLVCASRSNSGATYDNIGDPQVRATHCDAVTEVQPGRIRVIGGNVSQTVGEKWLRTLPDGRLSLVGAQSRLFAVIRCRSAPASAPAPIPPPAAGMNARVLQVMRLLVHRYGFPVNGAAGLVGNLIVESDVQPNRIERSDEPTPMRAPDFAGRVRTFTPDEVRTRSLSRRTGPLCPGVGIAQWSQRGRRAGLFRHVFRGRQLGSAILSDLDAQVDYLVTELRSREFGRVHTTLMAHDVTVEQAADVVLFRFERSRDVLTYPRTHPRAQRAIRRRRAEAARALRIYRAASGR
jgi:Uncharacterized protein conserved in bacteria (DUF2272)/Phage tail lysozyme